MSKGNAAANPFKRLVYVYIGTSSFDADLDFYENKLRASSSGIGRPLGRGSRLSTSAASRICCSPTT
jgi:hypothetical protein